MERLRIAINAQLMPDGAAGGTVTVLRALTSLTYLDDGAEEYVFIGPPDAPEWLRPMLGPSAKIIPGPTIDLGVDKYERLKRALGPLRPTMRELKRMFSTPLEYIEPNFYERLNCDVVHFPFQVAEKCSLPVVYNPHDLQHLHYPEFFSAEEIANRERSYPDACRAAETVVVASEFVKDDVVKHYGISPDKIQVISWAPPPLQTSGPALNSDGFASLKEKYDLPDSPFALYPAMTWEHKNHLRLLQALALLRDRDNVTLRLVCTGHKTEFWSRIESEVKALALEETVKFVGLIPNDELSVLYRAAQFVCIPSLFEAASAPMFEAWQHDVPVASSSIISLREQAADGALMFDPQSIDPIAEALRRMATDESLREALRRCGRKRLRDFSLERTAKTYRAVYRRAAGRFLSDEDRWLLCSNSAPTP